MPERHPYVSPEIAVHLLRPAPPPGISTTFYHDAVAEAGTWAEATMDQWRRMARLAVLTPSHRLAWAERILDQRDPVALATFLQNAPEHVGEIVELAQGAKQRVALERCSLWKRLVGPIHPTAHGRLALLDRFSQPLPTPRLMEGLRLLEQPLVASGALTKAFMQAMDVSWSAFWSVLPAPADRAERQRLHQAARGRVKGPKGGDPARRPPKA